MRLRIELRSRWREWLAIALFAGLAGGLVIAAAAGARRTDSALTRHLVAYRFPDAEIPKDNGTANNSGSYFEKTMAHVRSLPQVTASAETAELGYCARDRDNRPLAVTGPRAVEFTVNVDGRYGVALRRPKLLRGRLPDPRRTRDVLLDTRTAGRLGVQPGDAIPIRIFPTWTSRDFTCDPRHQRPQHEELTQRRAVRQILLACKGADACHKRRRFADRLYTRLRRGADFAQLARRYSDIPDAKVTGGRFWASRYQAVESFDKVAFGLPAGAISRPIRTRFGWHIVQPVSPIVAGGELIRLRVVGVAATTEPYPLGSATLTPAFHHRYWADSRYASYSVWVRLRGGAADIPGLGADVIRQSDSTAKIQPSVHHEAQALWIAAGFGALLALLLVAPAFLRLAAVAAADNPTLRTIGMTREQLFAVDVTRAAVIGAVAALVSVGGAYAASPLTPVGFVRELEPDPGFAFDSHALVVGAAAVFLALTLVGALTSARTRPVARPLQAGSLADVLARWGLPLTTISGVRLALARGRPASAVPIAAALISATAAVAVVAVALTFTASLEHLFSTPRLYGQNWDYRTNYVVPTLKHIRADSSISDAARGEDGTILVYGRTVVVSAMDDVKGRIEPVVTAGRPPSASNELALSANTLDALHLGVGDWVAASGRRAARMRIVGRAVLPESVCNCPRPRGAMTFEALKRLDPHASPVIFEARIATEADHEATLTRLEQAYTHPRPGPPKTIADFEGIRNLPVVASALLAAIAVAALAHTLATAIRRRRRHLAVLKTLGFDRRQLLATVGWQAVTYAAIGLLVGLPLGVAAGRWAWYLFATEIDVVPEPVTPVGLVFLLVPAAVVLALGVAALPAWSAARTRAAVGPASGVTVVRARAQTFVVAAALAVEILVVGLALHILLDWPPRILHVGAAALVPLAVGLALSPSARIEAFAARLVRPAVSLVGLTSLIAGVYVLVVAGLGRPPTPQAADLARPFAGGGRDQRIALPPDAPSSRRVRRATRPRRSGNAGRRGPGLRRTALPRGPARGAPVAARGAAAARLGFKAAEIWTLKGAHSSESRPIRTADRRRSAWATRSFRLSRARASWAAPRSRSGCPTCSPTVTRLDARGAGRPRRGAVRSHRRRAPEDEQLGDEVDAALAELARETGLVLRNVRLDSDLQASLAELRRQAEELRASRARVVAAADEERRRIERDLHDGAQQHLVGLAANLGAVQRLIEDDPEDAKAVLDGLQRAVRESMESLRVLAHGVYPPLLEDRGLAEALAHAARSAAAPANVDATGLSRYDPGIETAVYFCCLESLQNAAKHAGDGARARVRV